MRWAQVVVAVGFLPLASVAAAAPAPVSDQVCADIMPSFQAMEAAANVHDADAHVAFFAKDPGTVFLAGDHTIVGWQAILEQQRKWWPGGRIKAGSETPYTLTAAPDCTVLDPKATLLSFILDAPKANPDGTRVERTIGVTQLWRKRPEGWRVVYAHESVTVKISQQ